MNIHNFIFGPMHSMDKPAYSWWNSKRKEYNIKFFGCLFFAQLLFVLVTIGSASNSEISFVQKFIRMLVADLLIIVLINLIYFFWPTLEVIFFKKVNSFYRKYFFAFLNIVNLLIPISALAIVFIAKV